MAESASPMRETELLHVIFNVFGEIDVFDRLGLKGGFEKPRSLALHVFDLGKVPSAESASPGWVFEKVAQVDGEVSPMLLFRAQRWRGHR